MQTQGRLGPAAAGRRSSVQPRPAYRHEREFCSNKKTIRSHKQKPRELARTFADYLSAGPLNQGPEITSRSSIVYLNK